MSHSSSKKSVFDRIEGTHSAIANTSATSKNSHSFSKSSGTVTTEPNEHEQISVEKTPGTKDEFRITKTITRIIDNNPMSMKSTVTISNEQKSSGGVTNRTVIKTSSATVESPSKSQNLTETDRRHSGSDRRNSKSSDSKSSKKKKSSHDRRRPTSKQNSPISSSSESELHRSSNKRKNKTEHVSSSKSKRQKSKSPENEANNNSEQSSRHGKSPKRTILISSSNEKSKSKSKSEPEIEFLGTKKIHREKKSNETIHQQAENNKKSADVKREKRSPLKISLNETSKAQSSSNKTEEQKLSSSKTSDVSERSDRKISQSAQLSPSPITNVSEVIDKIKSEQEKSAVNRPISPVVVILDDDSRPSTPNIEEKSARTSSSRKTPTSAKRSRESEKVLKQEPKREKLDVKRSRTSDEIKSSNNEKLKKTSSTNETRSTSHRSETRRSETKSSRDDSSTRKNKDKTSRDEEIKERKSSTSNLKVRSHSDRYEKLQNSSERKRSTNRTGKEKKNHSDSENETDQRSTQKISSSDFYNSLDWSSLSRDKRIPINHQVTSRATVRDGKILESLAVCRRLLSKEQTEKVDGQLVHCSPLSQEINYLKKQNKSTILSSCHRRFGSCAKDMIDMRHKWFIQSNQPIEKYDFISKEHFKAYEKAINSLLGRTVNDVTTVTVEPTVSEDVLA